MLNVIYLVCLGVVGTTMYGCGGMLSPGPCTASEKSDIKLPSGCSVTTCDDKVDTITATFECSGSKLSRGQITKQTVEMAEGVSGEVGKGTYLDTSDYYDKSGPKDTVKAYYDEKKKCLIYDEFHSLR